MQMKRAAVPGVLGLLLAVYDPSAFAETITFDSLDHGRIIANQFADMGVTITADNPNRPFDIAAAFDTNETGTADLDLEFPVGGFPGGNLGGMTPNPLNVVMILAENNDTDMLDPDLLTDPDDERGRPNGSFTFDFSTEITSFGFDFLDIQDGEFEKGTPTNSRVEFFSGMLSEIIFFEDFPGGLAFGDNFANTVAPVSAASFGFNTLDKVVIHLGGSGGIDNINFAPVPEPGTWLLVSFGVLGFAAHRQKGSP